MSQSFSEGSCLEPLWPCLVSEGALSKPAQMWLLDVTSETHSEILVFQTLTLSWSQEAVSVQILREGHYFLLGSNKSNPKF